ncbi:hypothetical protein [Methylorubrum extorquens]|uniref:hypothetical protein n=1 Tax=Methylorubrum extorquens TaxID=408 RepID=UPI0020A1D4D2|nr:hypothetical protein [Methylorubrum extorquens]MCP1540058.1 hypothetical protein [Methylorubrum extorquens]
MPRIAWGKSQPLGNTQDTMASQTNLIDLDAVDNFPDVTVLLGGKEHKLVPVSVDDFVKNTKLLAALGKGGDLEAEVKGLKEIIVRAFPTMDIELLGKVPLVNLNKLVGVAQGHDGTNQVQGEAEAQAVAEGKPAAQA